MSCDCCQKDPETAGKFQKLENYIDSLPEVKTDRARGVLIQILHHAQEIFGYLPEEVQVFVSKKMGVPHAEIYGIISFYSYFTTKPKGRYKIAICTGTACYVKGSEKVLEELERHLGIKADQDPTADGMFSLSALRCVGACGLAPVMMVNGQVYGKVTPAQAVKIIEEYKQKG